MPRHEAGFSILEATVVMAAIAIVAATAGSHLSEYLDVARTIKAKGDVRTLVTSVRYFLNDVGRLQSPGGGPPPSLLVSDGDPPEPAGDDQEPWALPVDGGVVQDVYAHLVENTVGYTRWRGPYVEGLGSDPWGVRYGINVGCLTASGTGFLTIVSSPGPDGVVEAGFREKVPTDRGSDDVIAMLATGKVDEGAPRREATSRLSNAPSTPTIANLCASVAPLQGR